MGKYAVVYWSGTGNTEAMAEEIAEGIRAAGKQAELFTAAEFSDGQVAEYDGIAFGCPSMGAEELESEEFAPMFEAVLPLLKEKKVALMAGEMESGCAIGRRILQKTASWSQMG